MEQLGIVELKAPEGFWEKLNQHRALQNGIPQEAKSAPWKKRYPRKHLSTKLFRGKLGSEVWGNNGS